MFQALSLVRAPLLAFTCAALMAGATLAPASVHAGQPEDNKAARVVAKLVAAAGSQGFSMYVAKDDSLLSIIGEAVAKRARDMLIESALEDLMEDAPGGVHRGIRRVAGMLLDGELTVASYTAETAKEEFIEALKYENVNYGYLAEGADFLYELYKAYRTD